jgi:hypothetical protein
LIGGSGANIVNSSAQNQITGATIGGGGYPGAPNQINGNWAVIGGGYNNTVGYTGTIAGGFTNTCQGPSGSTGAGSIGGGGNNQVTGDFGTIAGGFSNKVSGPYAAIPGGYQNTASGAYSFAAGNNATAIDPGSFVWADSGGVLHSAGPNSFVARAVGGVTFYSSATLATGVTLPSGSGSWATTSDRNAKANFAPVDVREIAERVASLPIQTWNYKSQDPKIRHVGPTAQDFKASFAVGEDDRHISTIDEGGVALAAIQGLHQIMKEKDAKIAELERKNGTLESRLAAIEKALGLSGTPSGEASKER